jgi:hypothetical protein
MTVAAMRSPSPLGTIATPRRGMLLLLVLSILALFVVIGGLGILLALRAREAARAFAAATAGTTATTAVARAQLDEALLKLIRGSTQPGGTGDVSESLLEDKYGTSQTCQVTALSGTGAAVMTARVAGIDTSSPAAIAGRVLTFVPAAGDPTGPSSYRILGVNAGSNLLLANVKQATPLPPPSGTCEAVINGREFADAGKNEAYDAFDARNPFLTRPVLQASMVASVKRPAFGAEDATCDVDNDGDGVPDGIWLDGVVSPQPSPDGGQLSFSVSYLVLDLDGRINLNAHGSFVRAQVPQSQYPKDVNAVPPGLGYGPADVDAALAIGGQAASSGTNSTNRWAILLQGGTLTRVSPPTQWRPTPRLDGASQPGRYGLGVNALPGGSIVTGTNPLNADFWVLQSGGNSPSDLKARLQVFTEGTPPVLRFTRPLSSGSWTTPDTDDVLGTGTATQPYRLRLDHDAPRAAGTIGDDAVFTVAELERILRPFDADAATLAPRLAAMLDDYAERSRMTVTTDSWDTPAVTGTAAQRLAALGGSTVSDVLSPETVAGLRFNLNRPLVSGSARQDYFRQLYTLVVALSGSNSSPAEAAQWVANVIEFRDPDSIMTWYPYDPTPLDGTWTTGTGVWGVERPEMVITNALAQGNQATVMLYRPWRAECTGPNTIAAERIDGCLGNQAANTLNASGTNGVDPVWRLSVGGSATGLNTILASATAVPPNSELPPATLTAAAAPTQVILQRLADPTRPRNTESTNPASYNDYVPVHAVPVPTVNPEVSRWLHWPNRDFVSHGELLAVPAGDPATVADACFNQTKETSLARTVPTILDATLVPSRFTGANVSVANAASFLAGTGLENFQHSHFSTWREPGRVNVNTVLPNVGNTPSSLNDAVWVALTGRTGMPNPVTDGQYNPITSDRSLLVTGGDARFPRAGADAASAFLGRSTAIRLANCGTVRSHVFAVWITLRITDSSPNASLPHYARLFAIVDRSIPVGYAPGRNLNVRDTIRLQRFLP